jgi:hypothetical protein
MGTVSRAGLGLPRNDIESKIPHISVMTPVTIQSPCHLRFDIKYGDNSNMDAIPVGKKAPHIPRARGLSCSELELAIRDGNETVANKKPKPSNTLIPMIAIRDTEVAPTRLAIPQMISPNIAERICPSLSAYPPMIIPMAPPRKENADTINPAPKRLKCSSLIRIGIAAGIFPTWIVRVHPAMNAMSTCNQEVFLDGWVTVILSFGNQIRSLRIIWT